MKKKTAACAVALSLIASTLVMPAATAEEIKIEAENYTTTTSTLNITNNNQLSNSKYVRIYDYPPAAGYTIGYTFEVTNPGLYLVTAVGSDMDKVYTSDWDVYMNTEDNTSSGKVLLEHLDVSSIKDVMKKFSFGTFRLKKGKNTLYVKVNTEDLQSQDMVVTFLDYFTISQAGSGNFSVSGLSFDGSDSGVFTEDEAVKMNIEFTTTAPEETNYKLRIVDAWNRETLSADVTAAKGMEMMPINIGKFEPGWYRAYIYEPDGTEPLNSYTAFSVTHSPNKRTDFEDTAFASDLAAEYDTGSMKRSQSIAEAMSLSGFDWIRSRGMGKATTEQQLKLKKQIDAQGIKTVEVMGSAVGYVNDESDVKFRNDLYETSYSFWRDYPKYEEGSIDMVEVFNELDNAGDSPGADLYSAYFKAAAVGLADSGYDPYVSATGLAMYSGLYFDLLMQNGVLNYSDIYNFHAHSELETRVSHARQNADVYSEGESVPIYLTEAGIHQIPEDGENLLSYDQMRESARYGVTSAVTSLSYGTDKHFWFISRPYMENSGNYSSFNTPSYYPYPVYTSIENMTYQLGEGIYKGEFETNADGVTGELFDTGTGHDTAVFWSEQPSYITIKADGATYIDMYGHEERLEPVNGTVTVSVSQDPIYIRFDGKCDISNYYPVNREKHVIEKHELDVNDRIVIQPLWQDVDTNDSSVKYVGYSLAAGKSYTVDAVVYNLNGESVSGTIGAELSDGSQFDLSIGSESFSIQPWGKVTIPITLKANGNATAGKTGELKISGALDGGGELSPSVSAYNISMRGVELSDDQVQLFDGALDRSNWDLTNIQESGTISYSSDKDAETFTMQATFGDPSTWYFPKLKVDDASFMVGTSGISFKRQCSDDSVDTTTVFVYLKDGREYYSGAASGVAFSTDLETLTYPWSCFSLFRSPLGNVDIREFDVSLIEYVAIGVSGGIQDKPATTISDFGVYTLDGDSNELNPGSIELSGVEYMGTYDAGEELTLNAVLPSSELTDVKVLCYNNEYENWSQDGDSVTVDLSGLEKGKYEIKVCAKNNMDYYYVSKTVFYIK